MEDYSFPFPNGTFTFDSTKDGLGEFFENPDAFRVRCMTDGDIADIEELQRLFAL